MFPCCLPDEAGNVDVSESCHQVLTVEAVHDAAVARNGVGKILREQNIPCLFHASP